MHERLYEKGKKDESQLISQFGGSTYREEPSKFMPNIGEKSKQLVREEKIENLLYKDAQRRKEKLEKNIMEKNTQKVFTKKKYVSSKSEKIVVQKFMKDFDSTIDQMLGKECRGEARLDYITMSEILKKMGFLNCTENSESAQFSQERTLLHDIWIILNGNTKKGIIKRNLCVFLLAII